MDATVSAVLHTNPKLDNMLTYATQNGLFFKEKNNSYWYPSLNAGIPKVSKPDPIHQSIYTLHDIVHTILPDPLPSTNKRMYMMVKILGEIYSNILADGYAVHTLAEQGIDYDFSKRRVYPLFRATANHFPTPEEALFFLAETVAHQICLPSEYRGINLLFDLLPEDAHHTLTTYFNYYKFFFDTDIVWNMVNYETFFENKTKLYRDCIYSNQKLLKNEHYYHRLTDSDSLETVCNLFKRHISSIFNANLKPRGDGKLLGDRLSLYDYDGKPSIYEHIKMTYGDSKEADVLRARSILALDGVDYTEGLLALSSTANSF